mgnify:CR=1 FL=1
MKKSLFSVVILVYRHYEYLKTALDSVLSQDYDNIELIVSDDGSPGFPAAKIQKYIDENKGNNITSVLVRCEPQNVGTVRHLNHVRKHCSGDYIAFLAGDDAFYGTQALTSYHLGFLNAPSNCYVEMAQTAMLDEKLKNVLGYYMTKPVQDALVETACSTDTLKKMLAEFGACLPTTSTCFKKEFFEHFGDFDERYKLVEDFPMHCRLANENYIIHYVNCVTIKHRDGGISHGQNDTLSASSRSYYSDVLKMDRELVLPLVDQLPPKERKFARRRWMKEILWLDSMLSHNNLKPGVRAFAYGLLRFVKGDFKKVEPKRFAFFNLFVLLSLVKGWIGQMYIQEFSFNMGKILGCISWLAFAVYVFLAIETGIRRLWWRIKKFPREVISLG